MQDAAAGHNIALDVIDERNIESDVKYRGCTSTAFETKKRALD